MCQFKLNLKFDIYLYKCVLHCSQYKFGVNMCVCVRACARISVCVCEPACVMLTLQT